ncbi:DUF3843 family protein [Bacteroides fragilis]|nr:DUF3843 family protein [Bacteroides fragilis]
MKLQKIYRQLWMEVHPRPQSADTDQWYVDFANRLLPLFEKSELTGQMIHKNRAVLYFTLWYLEDCVNNSGGWNKFIRLHKRLYGRFLPFYTLTGAYADDEINFEDVSFLLWSLLSPVTDDSPVPWNPTDKSLLRLAADIYALLEAHFEQAPLTDDESMDWLPEIRALLPPPGPVLDIFPEMELPHDVTKFLNATQGKQLVYFEDYAGLRRFCVDALEWADEDDSLMPELADEENFVFFANPKGILLAPNIGACFRDERNSTYNPGIAEQEGAELFYVPGLCPIDLLHYAMQHDLLSEVTFPFEDGRRVLHENWDFIARRYLGKYYNEDFYEEERK